MDFKSVYDSLQKYREKKNNDASPPTINKSACKVALIKSDDIQEVGDTYYDIPDESSFSFKDACLSLKRSTILSTIIWICGFIYFIHLQFGAIYFLCSLLIFICLQTKSRKKIQPPNDNDLDKIENVDTPLSAYSVFNPNCERIQGTFSGDDIDRNLRRGGGANPIGFLTPFLICYA